jgi:3,4-dihydroxy 2-butanone 4-phosphate synthase
MKEDVSRFQLPSQPIWEEVCHAWFSPETSFADFVCEERFNMSSSSASTLLSSASLPFEERFPQAVADMRRGHPVILVDDFDRENEADLIVAAEKLSAASMAVLIRECSGIVCLCLPAETLERLQIPLMVSNNESRFHTAFTVTIEAREGVTTGVSAQDRVTTIRAAIKEDAQPSDLVSPGHVFPLRAAPGGVLERKGHTEGAVELARLAGLKPAAVLCEITNADGTMAKGNRIDEFAEEHEMVVLSIAELVAYRLCLESTHNQAK